MRHPAHSDLLPTLGELAERMFGKPYGRLRTAELELLAAERRRLKREHASGGGTSP